jgi:hypothetical protein
VELYLFYPVPNTIRSGTEPLGDFRLLHAAQVQANGQSLLFRCKVLILFAIPQKSSRDFVQFGRHSGEK